ncbi:3'-5' RNA exonuclease complex component [Batrachochytrium dendrobatidis]|nr:3'-5' RNA exonuclease complex component [Batrachochytrium dendrobatidis]KAK5670530.1 3'-5' RNA exonuclease complex component [Batrachochytrium dendrobatidis]
MMIAAVRNKSVLSHLHAKSLYRKYPITILYQKLQFSSTRTHKFQPSSLLLKHTFDNAKNSSSLSSAGLSLESNTDLKDSNSYSLKPFQLQVGDLVEVRRQGKVQVGVLIKAKNSGFSSHMTLLGNGHVLLHSQSDVFFNIPYWIKDNSTPIPGTATKVALGMSTLTASQLQIKNIPKSITHNIIDFQRLVDGHMTVIREKSELIHSELIKGRLQKEISKGVDFSTADAAKIAFDVVHPTHSQLYCTFLFLCKNNMQFVPADTYKLLESSMFRLRPKKEHEQISWIMSQVRQTISGNADSHFTAFLNKSKTLIQWFRTGSTALVERPSINFTAEDKIFINTILQSLSVAQNFPSFERTFSWVHVLKRIAPLYSFYPGEADVILFLKEIGVHAPWENIALHQSTNIGRPSFMFGEEGDLVTQKSDALGRELCVKHNIAIEESVFENADTAVNTEWSVADRFSTQVIAFPSAMNPLSTESKSTKAFYENDIMASSRVDFGQQPVYIIDSSTANELDDGISLEETPQGTWIHIHIADPTAYIPPNHELSLLAQLRGNSLYLPERHFPMMPDYLSSKLMGLDVSSYSLTFSARLSTNGEIIDYKVAPGYIRKPVVTRYDDVDNVLDWSQVYGMDAPRDSVSPWTRTFLDNHISKMSGKATPDANDTASINKIKTTAPVANVLTENDASNLKKLHQFALLHQKHRISQGAFIPDQINASVRVEPHPLPLIYDPKSPLATPDVVMSELELSHLSPSHILVSEMMIIAGRVAAKFCQDHNIPVPYRGQASVFDSPKIQSENQLKKHDTQKYIETMLSTRDQETGILPMSSMLEIIRYLPAGQWSTKPICHSSMGIHGICPLTMKSTADRNLESFGQPPSLSSMTGYVKASSPLRRYNDIMVHWQIKSVFLRKQMHSDPSAKLSKIDTTPFSLNQVTQLIPFLQRSTLTINDMSNRAGRFWKLEWVRRRELMSLHGDAYDPNLLRMVSPRVTKNGSILSAAAIAPLDFKSTAIKTDQVRKQVNVYTAIVVESPELRKNQFARVQVIELGGLRTICEMLNEDGELTPLATVIQCVVEKCDPSMGRLQLKQI